MANTHKTETAPIYYGYNLNYDSYTEVTRQADPNETYDGDDTQTDWTISDDLVENESTSAEFAAPFKVITDKSYYAVYVIYSTGDSFSQDDAGRISFVELFETKTKAQNLVDKIMDENKTKEPLSMTYLDEKDNEKTCSCDWNGYFESIDTCEAKEVSLQSLKKKIKKRL